MGKINLGRVLIGGIAAGIIFFIGDGVVHGALLYDRWVAILAALGKSGGDAGSGHPEYFISYDLLKGLLAIWIYAAIRPRHGAGPATALIAAIVVWLLVIPVPMLGLLPMEFFGARFVARWAIYGFVPIALGTLVGAWLYRESGA
ncbi:MAG: hypothetical protein ACREQB_02855 [Candidatus Binataceae bacterium]